MRSRAESSFLAVTTISSSGGAAAGCAKAAPAPIAMKLPIASDRREIRTSIQTDSRLMPIMGIPRACGAQGLERGRGPESDRWGVRPEAQALARLLGDAVTQ